MVVQDDCKTANKQIVKVDNTLFLIRFAYHDGCKRQITFSLV